jgi:hypothetical protein
MIARAFMIGSQICYWNARIMRRVDRARIDRTQSAGGLG